MATAIGQRLFGYRGVHGVSEFRVSACVLHLRMTPGRGRRCTRSRSSARLGSPPWNRTRTAPGDLDPPWDVIGFDSEDLGGGRWRLGLHCHAIEWSFESSWPVVLRADA